MVGALLPYVNDTMSEITDLEVGDKVEWEAGENKTAVGVITDKYTAVKGSALSGDRREVVTCKVEVLSDDVYQDTDIVDEEMFDDGTAWAVAEDDDDEAEIVTDGGEDITEHVSDETIETAIKQNGDIDHPETPTVEEVRELLAHVQTGAEAGWNVYMDMVEEGNASVVHEGSDLIILQTGEFDHVAEEIDNYNGDAPADTLAKTIVTQIHHTVAKQYCDYSWSASYPYVIRKPESFDAGERYANAVVNGLQRHGLSPGQAWAYFGVEIQGNSMNNWGRRKGDADHKNVSDALEKARQKLPGAN